MGPRIARGSTGHHKGKSYPNSPWLIWEDLPTPLESSWNQWDLGQGEGLLMHVPLWTTQTSVRNRAEVLKTVWEPWASQVKSVSLCLSFLICNVRYTHLCKRLRWLMFLKHVEKYKWKACPTGVSRGVATLTTLATQVCTQQLANSVLFSSLITLYRWVLPPHPLFMKQTHGQWLLLSLN